MKIERFQERILTFVVIALGLLFALLCGKLAGSGNYKALALIFQMFGLIAVCLTLRDRVWMIIPFCWPLTAKIPLTGIPFAIRDWAVILVFGCFLVLSMLKLFRDKPKFDLVDLLIGLSLLNLTTVFVRNPVGADWLGSQLVGGKPYFNIFIASLAYFVIARSPINATIARRLPVIVTAGAVLIAIGGVVVAVVPESAGYLGMIYSSFAPDENLVVEEAEVERNTPLASGGLSLALLLAARFDPLTLISPRYPLRVLGMILSVWAILLSGFRSFMLAVFIYTALSAALRKQYRQLLALCVLGGFAMAVLAIGNNRMFTLPLAAQRALSFLPGKWDYVAVADAENSVKWRWEIWEMALMEDKWIQNKWLGDGFGFTKHQLSIMNSRQGFLGGAASQEAFLVAGNYHSGPISTIRYVGGVGLILFIPLMGLLVVRFLKLIKRSSGTPYFTTALLIGLPIIYLPIPWTLIAGSFDGGFIDLLYAAGFLKLLERGLEQHDQEKGEGRLENAIQGPPVKAYGGYDGAPVPGARKQRRLG